MKLHKSHSDSVLLIVSGGPQYQAFYKFTKPLWSIYPTSRVFLIFSVILIKAWNVEYCCLKPDKVIVIETSMQSFIRKFFKYFLKI